ncbi:hypothetical protein HYV86_00740 [Candidatus Woesearchaeota archaeon]|nr:hypothetical protein [Candidatus Woesearchaeota archaeon]
MPISDAFTLEGNDNSRAIVFLDDGYAVKMRPRGQIDGRFHTVFCSPNQFRLTKPDHVGFQEETNAGLLKKYGFTLENGFYLPEHRVIGLEINDGKIQVNENGVGFSITDDISEEGKYEVSDVKPYFFLGLDNGKELFESYEKHVNALLDFYRKPNIASSINRHGSVINPIRPLSRMLLVRTYQNRGEIFIGDLDNILFEEADPEKE